MQTTTDTATALIHSNMGTSLALYEVCRPAAEELARYAEWVRPTMHFGRELRAVPGTITSAHVPNRSCDVTLPMDQGWLLTPAELDAILAVPATVPAPVAAPDSTAPRHGVNGYCDRCESYCYGDCQS